MSQSPMLRDHTAELGALCRQFHVRRLDLFGSAATGAFSPGRSDLDFLVEFEPVEATAYAEAYFGLRDGLISLFRRPVDLVTDASLANPFFRNRVLAERQAVFTRA